MIGKPQTSVKATLDADGNVRAKAVATCAYGSRTSTADTEITDKKALTALKTALTDAGKTVEAEITQQATADACKGLVVATDKGEKV